jgi:hypothetical protein
VLDAGRTRQGRWCASQHLRQQYPGRPLGRLFLLISGLGGSMARSLSKAPPTQGTYCCMAAPLSSSFLLHVYMHQVISMPVIIMVTITLIHCSNLENAQAQHIPLLNQERETLHIDISPFSNIVQKHDKLLCNCHVGKVVLYYYYVFFFLGVVLLLWPSNLISAINCIYV